MRQHHRAGEKYFVDYGGATVPIIDGSTGESREAQREWINRIQNLLINGTSRECEASLNVRFSAQEVKGKGRLAILITTRAGW